MVANLEGTSTTSPHYKLPTVSRWNSDQSRQIYLFVQPSSEMYYFSVQVQRFTSDAIALSTRQSACQVELRVSTKLRIRVKFGMKIAQSAIFLKHAGSVRGTWLINNVKPFCYFFTIPAAGLPKIVNFNRNYHQLSGCGVPYFYGENIKSLWCVTQRGTNWQCGVEFTILHVYDSPSDESAKRGTCLPNSILCYSKRLILNLSRLVEMRGQINPAKLLAVKISNPPCLMLVAFNWHTFVPRSKLDSCFELSRSSNERLSFRFKNTNQKSSSFSCC